MSEHLNWLIADRTDLDIVITVQLPCWSIRRRFLEWTVVSALSA